MTSMSKSGAIVLALLLSGCAKEPRWNAVSTEAEPIRPGLAPPAQALTFAQVRNADGRIATLLVSRFKGEAIEAIDLTGLGAPLDSDVFDASAAAGEARLTSALRQTGLARTYAIGELLPSAAAVDRHLASGTNFPEHAEETASSKVFNFPKFGHPTPAITTVRLNPGVLLDYEVEICARFDRDIRSAADFDAARKGFFLCGDFTDRATLVRLVDRDDIGSGQGFSDAKSGPDFFPTGPFVVIPHDWKQFVAQERIVTRVNSELRQDARGGEMILDFRALVEKAITGGGGGRYRYQGAPATLLEGGVIARGSTLMSGTSEGVIFMPPTRGDIAAGVARYVFSGAMFRGEPSFATVGESFIQSEMKSGRYLKAGDRVEHASSSMGAVSVTVVTGGGPA